MCVCVRVSSIKAWCFWPQSDVRCLVLTCLIEQDKHTNAHHALQSRYFWVTLIKRPQHLRKALARFLPAKAYAFSLVNR